MSRAAIIALLFVLQPAAMSAVARAAQAPVDSTGPRTLAEYLSLARSANPSLKAAGANANAARERIGVARGYPDPSMLYGYYFDADPVMKGRSELTLMQEIPFFGKRGLRGDVAAGEAQVARRASEAALLDLEYEVKATFFELVRTDEVGRILEQEREVVARMRDLSFSRYSSGTAEQHEVLKLDVTVAQIDDQITMNGHEHDVVSRRLCELVGRDPSVVLPPPEWTMPEVSDVETSARVDSALARRPEAAAAQAEIAAAESSRRLAAREYFPDLVLGVEWEFGGGKDAMGERMGDSWEVMAGMNLPIWIGKRRAMSREAQARRESAEHGMEAVRLRVAHDVVTAIHAVGAAQERVQRFEQEILPRAEQSLRSAEAGYRAGRADFLDYLDSERMWLTMRKEYYGVVAELGMRAAALERALGARE